jgi:type II secretory pathway component HofQ
MMKMRYLDHLNYLSAILTIAVICFQGATVLSGALENQHNSSQMLTDNQIKDELNSMNTSELKELNHYVRRELEEKSMENPNNTMPGVLIDPGPGPHALNYLLENGSKAEGQATIRMPSDAVEQI